MAFEVRDTDSKGLGAFATTSLSPGSLILAEKPLLRIDKSYYMQSDVKAAFTALSSDQQQTYLLLASAHSQDPKRYPRRIHPSVDGTERQRILEQHKARTAADKSVLSIFMTNAMECGRGSAVFELASRSTIAVCPTPSSPGTISWASRPSTRPGTLPAARYEATRVCELGSLPANGRQPLLGNHVVILRPILRRHVENV